MFCDYSFLLSFYVVDIKVHFQAPCSSAIEANNFIVKDLLLCVLCYSWKFYTIITSKNSTKMYADNATNFDCFLVLSLLLSLLKDPSYNCRYILQVASCRLQVENVTKLGNRWHLQN